MAVSILALATAPRAQTWNGSLRLDYQSPSAVGQTDLREGTLVQQYHVRMEDRLWYKNRMTFLANLNYRTGREGQPVQFQPRYEWQLSGYGYGGRVSYEPYTVRRGGGGDQTIRRWRGGVYTQPVGWPRLAYDQSRTKQTVERAVTRDGWDSYTLSWQPGSHSLSTGYSRQVKTTPDSSAETIESYRAAFSSDRELPLRHRVALAYNFDRTWRQRGDLEMSAQNQHSPTVSLSGQPLTALGWFAQYNGRFTNLRSTRLTDASKFADQVASGNVTLTPAPPVSLALLRYVEDNEARADQPSRRVDYWQGRVSAEGRFYRQLRAQATVYRIAYTGAPTGERYSDAWFLAIRGRPHRHADWSTELSLSDRHGRQPERYAGNANIFLRLLPTENSQLQIGYTALAEARLLDDFDVSEESYNTNLQYTPEANLSLTGGVTVRRNRRVSSDWSAVWSATGSYRWPAFANISANYSRRPITSAGPSATSPSSGDAETLLADILVWLGPRTTLSANYLNRLGSNDPGSELWGVGLATQF